MADHGFKKLAGKTVREAVLTYAGIQLTCTDGTRFLVTGEDLQLSALVEQQWPWPTGEPEVPTKKKKKKDTAEKS